ncbi:gamma-glutamyltransferase family protein [Jiangella mangrovi]|uniref:Gamma-glutamyltranspeptidase/glutathione hydrolase n=1 Tax=Jiangella mangrovi TaxID=1524084 RepID=A0A7W9GN32_9ACTN|nr:gamma-glutamyltransferase [Jiangella mangrovi]MBB5786903.1 gamma-glutamyltranspeptidase/glutathione hydrolase [Jiangella mangrovi]
MSIVVCPQPLAAEAARDVLEAGGNAVDACVTAAVVQGVVDPLMCGFGGYGVMSVRTADGEVTTLDFFGRAPLAAVEGEHSDKLRSEFAYDYGFVLEGGENEIGYGSIATPGTVAGLATALERFGSLPWAGVLEPALGVATDGYLVTHANREQWTSADGPDKPGAQTRLLYSEPGRAMFAPDGDLVAVGSRIRNGDLAETLRRLMKAGAADFYTGEVGRAIAADLRAGGSALTEADLTAFVPEVSAPLRGSYRGYGIAVPPLPSGGFSVLQALNVLEVLFPDGLPDWLSADGVAGTADALVAAIGDKFTHLAGSRDTALPIDDLLSKEHARELAAALRAGAADDENDTEPPSTTHVAVVDAAGNAAAVTHTLASGSGVFTPGLGFMYNNFLHGYDPRPGRWNSLRPGGTRPASMSPGFVTDAGGDLVGVFGATGSTRIVTSIVQVLSHLIDRSWDPHRAVSAPRINAQRDGRIQLEGRFPSDVVRSLTAAGRPVQQHLRNYDSYFGKAHVLWNAHGAGWEGVADPRADGGTALVATSPS